MDLILQKTIYLFFPIPTDGYDIRFEKAKVKDKTIKIWSILQNYDPMILYFSFTKIYLPAIHCQWDDWNLGECSKTCGTGTRTNNRHKRVVEENGGTCTGKPTETEPCNTQECPG